jgi:diguanylate cyclase (GGDEF)-like protein
MIVMLPESSLESARTVAEKLKSKMVEKPVTFEGLSIPISISVGVAVYPGYGILNKQDLFNKADQVMLHAKQTGRNRIEVWAAQA